MKKSILLIFIGVIVCMVVIGGCVFILEKNDNNGNIKKKSITENNMVEENVNDNSVKDVDNEVEDDKDDEGEWKKFNIYDSSYYETSQIELDLDGDNKKEAIEMYQMGANMSIDGKDFVVNKYVGDDCDVNQFFILDLNGDGTLEVIHRTFSAMISPVTSRYTVYNYKDNELKEVGNMSFIGSIPEEIFVKGNTLKFEYTPFEAKEGDSKEIVCELAI